MTKKILLNSKKYSNKYALVDDDLFEDLNKFKWHIRKGRSTFYAQKNTYINGKRYSQQMHRLIMNPPDNMQIDHISGDGCDNRRHNLRICTNRENHQNRHSTYGTSKYKGIFWNKECNKWCAGICFNGKQIHLGYFKKEIDAAQSYNKKAIELFGEFAYLNQIEG